MGVDTSPVLKQNLMNNKLFSKNLKLCAIIVLLYISSQIRSNKVIIENIDCELKNNLFKLHITFIQLKSRILIIECNFFL